MTCRAATRRPTEPPTCSCGGLKTESCIACQMAVCPRCDEREGGHFMCVPCRTPKEIRA